MLPRKMKSFYYFLMEPFMYINSRIYLTLFSPRSFKRNVFVQLGPGQRNYIDGWINVDANFLTAKIDVWADLRHKLPFRRNSIDAFYSHHMVEHLPDLKSHFQSVYNCLKDRGVYRVGGPNGDSAIKKFLENDYEWFSDLPDKSKSIGGKLENFIFCKNEHLTILTQSMLEEIMKDIGFVNIKVQIPSKETSFPEIFSKCLSKENENDFVNPKTLILEAEKIC